MHHVVARKAQAAVGSMASRLLMGLHDNLTGAVTTRDVATEVLVVDAGSQLALCHDPALGSEL
jgi:hypothetical protein